MLIPKSVFVISKVTTTGSRRFALDAVQIERGGPADRPRAVASDGKRLIVAMWDEEDNPPAEYPERNGFSPAPKPGFRATVQRAGWDAAGKLAPKGRQSHAIIETVALDEGRTNGTVPFMATDLQFDQRLDAPAASDTFPPFDQFIPRPDETYHHVTIDAELLAELVTVMNKAAGKHDHQAIDLYIPRDSRSPIRMDARGPAVKVIGVLMPIASDCHDGPIDPEIGE